MRSESRMILRIVLKIEGEGTDKDGLDVNLASLLSMSIIVTSCYITCTSLVYPDLHHNHSLKHINKRLYRRRLPFVLCCRRYGAAGYIAPKDTSLDA